MRSKAGPSSKEIKTAAEADKFITHEDHSVVGTYGSKFHYFGYIHNNADNSIDEILNNEMISSAYNYTKITINQQKSCAVSFGIFACIKICHI